MTIYKSSGFLTAALERIDTDDPFEWVASQLPVTFNGSIEDFKRKQAPYFISGEIQANKSGDYKRNNKSVITRDLIIADLDDIELSESELIELVSDIFRGTGYILYPTISNGVKGVRYRLIVEPERPLNEQEYNRMIQHLGERLGVPIDATSSTWSQLEGLPTVRADHSEAYQVIVNRGAKLPLVDNLPSEAEPLEEDDLSFLEADLEPIAYDEAIEMVERYAKADADNLAQYLNFLSALQTIAKAYQLGQINLRTATECTRLLGLGNSDWEEGNQKKLLQEINNPNITTEYSFKDKFYNVLFYRPQSMDDLYSKLLEAGEDWRKKHTNDKGIAARMSENTASRILTKYGHFRLIGSNEDKSPLYLYDLDTGVYKASETSIHRYIKALEPRFNPQQWRNVVGHLRVDAELVRPLEDRNLIPVNNGIYNLKTRQLEEFSPDYVITSKIATNYIDNARKPMNLNFDFDNWLSTIACGDESIVTLLWQVINEAINPNHTRRKIGFMIGDGNSGKGSYSALLINLIGPNNVSALKPPEFGERFKTSSLLGKVCNIGDDISNAYIDEISNLMSIATGDVITVEEKNRPAYEVSLKLFSLFSGNDMPRARNRSEGWYRRTLIIPFNADFNGVKEDFNIKDKYLADKRVLEYVLNKAINLKFEKFIQPKALEKIMEDYRKQNDYVAAYVYDRYVADGLCHFEKVPVHYIKEDILTFFNDNEIRQTIPYHWTKKFISDLTKASGKRYEIAKTRYTQEEVDQLPEMSAMGEKLEIAKPIRSVVNK